MPYGAPVGDGKTLKERDAPEGTDHPNVFASQFRGWTFGSLCRHLGVYPQVIKRQLKLTRLKLEARPGHTLTDKDVETVIALHHKRRAERLYGIGGRWER